MPVAIVIVQADSTILEVLTVALRTSGCKVQDFSSAEDALNYLGNDFASVDLLITDYHLPGTISGQELASRVRRTNPSIPILIFSGEEWNGDRQAGFEANLKLRFFPASTYFVPLAEKTRLGSHSPTKAVSRIYRALKCLDPQLVAVWATIIVFLLLLWGAAIIWLI